MAASSTAFVSLSIAQEAIQPLTVGASDFFPLKSESFASYEYFAPFNFLSSRYKRHNLTKVT